MMSRYPVFDFVLKVTSKVILKIDLTVVLEVFLEVFLKVDFKVDDVYHFHVKPNFLGID